MIERVKLNKPMTVGELIEKLLDVPNEEMEVLAAGQPVLAAGVYQGKFQIIGGDQALADQAKLIGT